MSHFTVMVIGNDVEGQLQPFHEYECTGIKDQYVVWVDGTDEVRAEFEGSAEHKKEYGDLATFARKYYGYEESESEPGKYGRWTNPNRKWDWWVVGGRWTGYFKMKPGRHGLAGEPGLMTPRAGAGRADQARKGDIDFDGMRDEAGEKAAMKWEAVRRVIEPHISTFVSWEACREQCKDAEGKEDFEKARALYHGQPLRKAITAAAQDKSNPHHEMFFWLDDLEQYFVPKDVFVQRGRDSAISTFAVLDSTRDPAWMERGEMGWWGAVANEKDKSEWDREFNKMRDALPDDTMLSIVDCHI